LRIVEGRLDVVAFEEGLVSREGGLAVVQRVAAVGSQAGKPCRLA
jgi:hypothetical protein